MGNITLIQGDCKIYLHNMADKSVDAIITDPPYLEGDLSDILAEFMRVARRVVLTPGKLESFNWIQARKPVWEYAWRCSGTKSLGGSACLHIGFEPILAYTMPVTPLGIDVLDFPLVVDPTAKGHPWPKPLGLFRKLVAHWSKPGEVVLDPYMGSGTTGKACIELGRRFIGLDIEPIYYAIAEHRLNLANQQPILFDA